MSKEAKHSPVPFRVVAGKGPAYVVDADGKFLFDCDVTDFILRAVNSHDALVSACEQQQKAIEEVLAELGGKRVADWAIVNDAGIAAGNALAKAREAVTA